jgi:hypothetical protein
MLCNKVGSECIPWKCLVRSITGKVVDVYCPTKWQVEKGVVQIQIATPLVVIGHLNIHSTCSGNRPLKEPLHMRQQATLMATPHVATFHLNAHTRH